MYMSQTDDFIYYSVCLSHIIGTLFCDVILYQTFLFIEENFYVSPLWIYIAENHCKILPWTFFYISMIITSFICKPKIGTLFCDVILYKNFLFLLENFYVSPFWYSGKIKKIKSKHTSQFFGDRKNF